MIPNVAFFVGLILGCVLISLVLYMTNRRLFVSGQDPQVDSLTVKLNRLDAEYRRLQGLYDQSKNRSEVLVDQLAGSRDTIRIAQRETRVARRELKEYRRQVFVAADVDSALKARYASYTTRRDSVMDLPIVTGSDIVNDLNEKDLGAVLIDRLNSEVEVYGTHVSKQDSLISELQTTDSVATAQKQNLEERLQKLDSGYQARGVKLDQTTAQAEKFKKQRNVSLWGNLLLLLGLAAK